MKDKVRLFNIIFALAITALGVYVLIDACIKDAGFPIIIKTVGLLAATWAFYLLELIFKVRVSKWMNTIFLCHFFLAGMLGAGIGFYGRFAHYDDLMHFVFGYVGCVAGLFIVCKMTDITKISPWFIVVVCFCVSMTLGGLWEMWEFFGDTFLGQDSQGTPSPEGIVSVVDTMMDIIFNCLGALIFTAHYVIATLTKRKLIIKSLQEDFAIKQTKTENN